MREQMPERASQNLGRRGLVCGIKREKRKEDNKISATGLGSE